MDNTYVQDAWRDAHRRRAHRSVLLRIKAYAERTEAVPDELRGYGDTEELRLASVQELYHNHLHTSNIPHQEEPDCRLYSSGPYTVRKAFNPVAKDFADYGVQKSWMEDGVLYLEGWVSTDHKDAQKDIVPPEAFAGEVFKSYYQAAAPISLEHNRKVLPIGHHQRGALVRDGKILQEEVHPTDPAEFKMFPGVGTGWYARTAINQPDAIDAVQKGNVKGFSWIGNLAEYEPLPDGGQRYVKIDPLMESTIAAYPVNQHALFQVAKAFIPEDNMEQEKQEKSLEELLLGAIQNMQQKQEAEKQAQEAKKANEKEPVTTESLTSLLATFGEGLLEKVEEKVNSTVSKAFQSSEKSGGRKGVINKDGSGNLREDDPVAYIVAKAQDYKNFDSTDKQLVMALTNKWITQGMSLSEDEE